MEVCRKAEDDDAATAAISMGGGVEGDGGGGTSSVGISPRPHQGRRTELTENFVRKSKSREREDGKRPSYSEKV